MSYNNWNIGMTILLPIIPIFYKKFGSSF